MSRKRSGLLSGLIIGLIAALFCTAAVCAAILFSHLIPEAVMAAAEGRVFVIGLGVAAGLLLALVMMCARPRSLVLPPLAALYAAAATVLGLVVGTTAMVSNLTSIQQVGAGVFFSEFDLGRFAEALPHSFKNMLLVTVDVTWPFWTSAASAALLAFVLVALRVRRLRRLAARAAEPVQVVEEEPEVEYRAPFEPAQAPSGSSAGTGDLFTPRKPARD
ncbi:hypothetical protein HII36_30235 [Nonomuraea sp. NN258]|uniref:hypothetical protein n=1 Tax=Nonomuraea antri TaxID=2730852 RepID=UPI0015697DB9|nr:hypothetical protein [Nonomuraea antri]NRQ36081.1 hypothetical protein [Nonomuraea antri]